MCVLMCALMRTGQGHATADGAGWQGAQPVCGHALRIPLAQQRRAVGRRAAAGTCMPYVYARLRG